MVFKKKEAVKEIAEETKEVIKETKSVKTYTVFEVAHMSKEDRQKVIAEVEKGSAKVIS